MGGVWWVGQLFAAELVDPAEEGLVVGGFNVEKFYAHADARFYDADYGEGFDGLFFVGHGEADAGVQRERLAGADEGAANGQVRGDTAGGGAGFQVKKLGVGGERIADGVAAVANGNGAPRT